MYGFFFAHHGRRVAKSTPPPPLPQGRCPVMGVQGVRPVTAVLGLMRACVCMCLYVHTWEARLGARPRHYVDDCGIICQRWGRRTCDCQLSRGSKVKLVRPSWILTLSVACVCTYVGQVRAAELGSYADRRLRR